MRAINMYVTMAEEEHTYVYTITLLLFFLTQSYGNDHVFIIYKNVHSCTHASQELQQYKQSALSILAILFLAFNYILFTT